MQYNLHCSFHWLISLLWPGLLTPPCEARRVILNLNLDLADTLPCRWSEKVNLWSKAIIKFKPFREAPDKKLGVQNDRLLLTRLFPGPKKWKSFLKVMDFCKTFWEIFVFPCWSFYFFWPRKTKLVSKPIIFHPQFFAGGFSKGF